jgi:hypothetical protein
MQKDRNMRQNRNKPTATASEAGKFDDALRRLIGVPKAEVDREGAKWDRMQERLTKKREARGKKRR